MSDETITLTDLARLAGVGRNAVSNWRRRESDFPDPVDDAARRPRFDLAAIERWAAEHERRLDVTAADRLWFSLYRRPADHALQAIGAALDGEGDLAGRVGELTAAAPAAEVFEFFVERAREAAGTGVAPGTAAVIEVAAACAPARDHLSVFDPACDEGDLLTGLIDAVPGVSAAAGRDLAPARAAVCERRLRLARPEASVRIDVGDSLLDPPGPERYDLVVCDPPFNVKDWGHDRLPAAAEARAGFGTPPRTEPELAWALHCVAALADDGVAVVRMPAQAAHRRSGRRLRAELLRWGALRAVVDHPEAKAHLWVLTGRGDASRLLVSTGEGLAAAWHAPESDPAGPGTAAVPLMRLWDEDVDISPAVYLAATETDVDQLTARTDGVRARLADAAAALPRFAPGLADAAPETGLADLERDGLIAVTAGPGTTVETAVIVDPVADRTVRLGPATTAAETQWTVTCDSDAIDPGWLAAVLTARLPGATKRTATGARRRLLAVKVPRLPLEEQRRRGRAFADALRLRDTLEAAAAEAAALTEAAAAGIADGAVDTAS